MRYEIIAMYGNIYLWASTTKTTEKNLKAGGSTSEQGQI